MLKLIGCTLKNCVCHHIIESVHLDCLCTIALERPCFIMKPQCLCNYERFSFLEDVYIKNLVNNLSAFCCGGFLVHVHL